MMDFLTDEFHSDRTWAAAILAPPLVLLILNALGGVIHAAGFTSSLVSLAIFELSYMVLLLFAYAKWEVNLLTVKIAVLFAVVFEIGFAIAVNSGGSGLFLLYFTNLWVWLGIVVTVFLSGVVVAVVEHCSE